MLSYFSLLFAGVVTTTTVEYKCDPLKWTRGPIVASNHFTGTLEDHCRVKSVSRAGFPNLRKSLGLKIEKDAETLHAGPIEKEYLGMDGTYYDITLYTSKNGVEVWMRGDNHIASDDSTVLYNDFVSTKITGKGLGAYLRESSARIEVTKTPDPEWYAAVFAVEVKVEKPPLLPASTFKAQVKKQMEDEALAKEPILCEEIATGI